MTRVPFSCFQAPSSQEPARNVTIIRPLVSTEQGQVYGNELLRQEAAEGAFPGTVVEGWAIFEIAENFETATVAIEYPDEAAAEQTFQWQFEN